MRNVHLYCDYWASVLGMRGIVSSRVQERGLVDLNIFRTCIDRPETRLPGIGYYILMLFLGPVLIPYRMIQRVASRLHVPLAGEAEAEGLLSPYRMKLKSQGPEPGNRVSVTWGEESVAQDLIDPERPDVVFSVVYPAYKILVAAVLAGALSLLSHWGTQQGWPSWLETLLLVSNYPLLAGLLYLIFREWLTALLAPLPVFLVLWTVRWMGPMLNIPFSAFPATLAGLAIAYFVVDAFMIPRAMAPALFFYRNEPGDGLHPYEAGQAPHWLSGKHYWVWRFVALTPAELHKAWERDWERVEVWVHADGENAGRIEWVVTDWHFRELWIPYEKLVTKHRWERQGKALHRVKKEVERNAAWVIEVDTNFVGHAPEVRGIFLLPLQQGWRQARIKQLLRSLRVQTHHDNPKDYQPVVRRLRLTGPDFIQDIPEHLRWYAMRELLSIPWRYWRYPRGAICGDRALLYGAVLSEEHQHVSACEPSLQFKAEETYSESWAGKLLDERQGPVEATSGSD